MDLFKDIVPSILQTKEYILTEDAEKEYSSYVVNKALSQHIDCIFHVAAINNNLDARLHYDYLFHSIKKYKRPYHKWFKNIQDSDIEIIKKYYNCSNAIAKTYSSILTAQEILVLQERLDEGGKVNNDK